jgi:hypothetical protein
MNYNEMHQAIAHAEQTLRLADSQTEKMIIFLVGRLRKAKSYQGVDNLKKLKKELSQFNATTGKWNN